MSQRDARLVILDWGIGGFGTYGLLRSACPDLDITYVSDAGFRPYGQVPRAVMGRRLEQIAGSLGASELVIACNAASSAVSDALCLPGRTAEIIGFGIGAAATIAAAAVGPRPCVVSVIGVVGGDSTIDSGRFQAELTARGHRVIARSAQPISAHIEAGRLCGDALERDLDAIMAPLSDVDVDILVLACTHYPAIAAAFGARAPGAQIIDPARAMVDAVVDGWGLRGRSGDGTLDVITTGSPEALIRGAQIAFGVDVAPEIITQFTVESFLEGPISDSPLRHRSRRLNS